MRGTLKREKIFNQGAQSLRTFGVDNDSYACPICCIVHGRDSLADGSLTLEHVPPKSIGGKAIVLTCRSCNNSAGSQYEVEHKRFDDQASITERILKGAPLKQPINVLATFGGIEVPAIISAGSKLEIGLSDRNMSPPNFTKVMANVSGKNGPVDIQIELPRPIDFDKLYLADTKSAFLAATALFGYAFALNDTLALVRKQILYPDRNFHSVKYAVTPNMPEKSIALCRTIGVVLVKIQGRVNVLPWIDFDYNHFLEVSEQIDKLAPTGELYWIPKYFSAILDRSKGNTFSFRKGQLSQ